VLALRFALANKAPLCIKTRQVALSAVRALNLASFIPLENLEKSPGLRKVWRIAYYETKEYAPVKPLFFPMHSWIFEKAGNVMRIA
jgi:hypothetical protein